jgi:hypothetical protein
MSDRGYLALGLGLLAVYVVAMAAVLFGGAGTLAVPMFWAYPASFAILCLGASDAFCLLSPDLVRERVRPGTRRAGSSSHLGPVGVRTVCVTGCRDRQPEATRSVGDSDTAGNKAAYDNACPIR